MDALKMPWRQFADLLDHPRQRNTPRHAEQAQRGHLKAPCACQAVVFAAEYGGRLYKLDGHTRSLLWLTGQLQPPAECIVHLMRFGEDYAGFALEYEHFDNRAAADGADDYLFGALREKGIVLESSWMARCKWGSIFPMLAGQNFGGVRGGVSALASSVESWSVELKKLDSMRPTSTWMTLAIAAAAVLSFRMHPDDERLADFWRSYVAGDRHVDGKRKDAVAALCDELETRRRDRAMGGHDNQVALLRVALSCAEAGRVSRWFEGQRPHGTNWRKYAKKASGLQALPE